MLSTVSVIACYVMNIGMWTLKGGRHFNIRYIYVLKCPLLLIYRMWEVTFPPHDPSDAGSNPAEVVEFLRTEKFRERSPPGGTFSRLTRVVDLLHVKEPQPPRGPLSKIADISRPSRASNSSGRWWCTFYLSALDRKGLVLRTTVLW
jgi:hypothetical protein